MMAFDGEAARHSFTLRCLPVDTLRQRVLSGTVRVLPEVPLTFSRDAFGNTKAEGTVCRSHTQFSVYAEGVVLVPDREPEVPVAEEAAGPNDVFLYGRQSSKTAVGPAMETFLLRTPDCDCCPLEKAVGMMHRVHAVMRYEKGVTDTATTAEEAMARGGGVCQDLAHVMISALRARGVPARYVVGYTCGEGESHAWVEVLHEGMWYGLDPTADRAVGPRHVKVSHGRDYGDCRINRGVYVGAVVASQQVSATVNRVYRSRS